MKKKRKLSLFLNISVLCLCFAAIAIGVYSAKNATLNVGGTVGFNAHNCKVRVLGKIEGAVNENNEAATDKTFHDPDDETKGRLIETTTEKWDFDTIYFNDLGALDNKIAQDIVFTFELTNESTYFDVAAKITKPTLPSNVSASIKINDTSDSLVAVLKKNGDPVKITLTLSLTDETNIGVDATNFVDMQMLFYKPDQKTEDENDTTTTVYANNLSYTINEETREAAVKAIKTGTSGDDSDIDPRNDGTTGEITLDANLVIPETFMYNGNAYRVTKIEEAGFAQCEDIETVTIPKSVSVIGYGAFSECTNLTQVNLPDGLIEIEYEAFAYSGLETINLASSIQKIGYGTFEGTPFAENLTDGTVSCSDNPNLKILATIKSNNINLNNLNLITDDLTEDVTRAYVFTGESAVYSYTDGMLIDKINKKLLCSSAQTGKNVVTIPEGIEEIGNNLFYKKITDTKMDVVLPSSVRKIGDNAFFNCTGITSINLNNITSIGYCAFFNCSNLTSINLDKVISIGDNAFFNCSSITSATITNTVKSIGIDAFYKCTNLNKVIINDLSAWCNMTFVKSTSNPLNNGADLYLNETKITNLVIPSTVKEIGNYLFYNCTSLTSVTIGDSVTSISDSSFCSCTSLTSLNIGSSLTNIGNNAFAYCSALPSLTIDGSVTKINYRAFYACSNLTSVTIGNNVTNIGNEAFRNCGNITEVNISSLEKWCNIDFGTSGNPLYNGSAGLYLNGTKITKLDNDILSGITEIKQYAFEGCSDLTSITITDSVIEIGRMAFSACKGLTTVTIDGSVTTIDEAAFYSCRNLTSAIIGDSVTSLGSSVFSFCNNLSSVTLSNNINVLAEALFQDCSKITSIIIPESVTSIELFAFNKCTGLTSIVIPDAVTSISRDAFYRCTNLTTTIGDGWVKVSDGCTVSSSTLLKNISYDIKRATN